ncbi:SDR family NAD(P)-dependent oxidoreductase [Sphingomonas sp. PsM26]|nr:SDR family NAD(P)-dependent oxidoreductase [Sphingomonas sp. PsM26]
MVDLMGKVAVVTGAARGIGRAAAEALAKAGADVVGVDIAGPVSPILDLAPATPDELSATGRAVEAAGRRWLAITLDQRDLPALRNAAAKVVETFGQIDVNLTGTMNTVRAFAPAIRDRAAQTGHGRIIVTSSTQGQHGTKHGAAYSASKWGIIGLMKSAALEFGEYGITVNALIPGLIDTALTRHEDRYAQAIQDGGKQPTGDEAKDEQLARQAMIAKTPLGVPWIDPADVAPMVVFLASDAARIASGGTYSVTGGDSAHGAA